MEVEYFEILCGVGYGGVGEVFNVVVGVGVFLYGFYVKVIDILLKVYVVGDVFFVGYRSNLYWCVWWYEKIGVGFEVFVFGVENRGKYGFVEKVVIYLFWDDDVDCGYWKSNFFNFVMDVSDDIVEFVVEDVFVGFVDDGVVVNSKNFGCISFGGEYGEDISIVFDVENSFVGKDGFVVVDKVMVGVGVDCVF